MARRRCFFCIQINGCHLNNDLQRYLKNAVLSRVLQEKYPKILIAAPGEEVEVIKYHIPAYGQDGVRFVTYRLVPTHPNHVQDVVTSCWTRLYGWSYMSGEPEEIFGDLGWWGTSPNEQGELTVDVNGTSNETADNFDMGIRGHGATIGLVCRIPASSPASGFTVEVTRYHGWHYGMHAERDPMGPFEAVGHPGDQPLKHEIRVGRLTQVAQN